MWIINALSLLFTILLCFGTDRCDGLKDIEVDCMDSIATTITDGGIIANCAFVGLTRTSTMNAWLSSLTNVLQSLNASHNHIKTVAKFPDLPRVLSVTLQHNSIKRLDSSAFSGLDNLQNLDLSYNRITGESLVGVLVGKKIDERYEPLPIRMLYLGHNNISSLLPSLFTHMDFLRELHLDNNPLSVDENFSVSLSELPELKLLNLAGSNLKYLPKDAFSGLSLSTLLLSGNEFTQVPELSVLGGSLRQLNINQNPIEELNETSFSGSHSLSEVMISGMPELTTIKSGTFSNLRGIRIVSCSYNPKLSQIDEKAFWDYKAPRRPPILEVYLNNNALTRLKKHVLPWVKMSKVTLDGNRWECDCRIHWLANYLRSRNTSIDRITELKCWEPSWLNGTQLLFWKIDTENRHENFPCLEEMEEERKEIERLKMAALTTTQSPLPSLPPPPPVKEEVSKGKVKFFHILLIVIVVSLVVLIVSLIGYFKYGKYRPIYNVEKMSSPTQNEMKYIKGNEAERTQLMS